jgi:cytosine deaminase
MLLPRLLEPHAHLDKAFSWSRYPNLSGTYAGAMAANLREHQTRTVEVVQERFERAMELIWRHGLRAVRTHIDSLGPGAQCSWDAILDGASRWQDRVTVQPVALVPVEHWGTSEGEQLAARVAASGGLLGGVISPPCSGRAPRQALKHLLALADRHGCGVDLHIDEASSEPAAGLFQLMRVLKRMTVSVPITCSHASSLSLLKPSALLRLAERMALHNIRVVALPLTNGWLLGRQDFATPLRRPLAPIRQLQRAGVCVAVGGDNVQDPWFPAGNFDPLALIAASLAQAQLAPWERLGLSPFTTAAARLMEMEWDGVIRVGAPADAMQLPVHSWAEALATPPERRLLVRGVWVQDST